MFGFYCRAFDYIISYFPCRNEPGSDLKDRAISQASSCLCLLKVILAQSAVSNQKIVETLDTVDSLERLCRLTELSLSSVVGSNAKGGEKVKQEEVNAHVCGEMQESLEALKKWLKKVLPNNLTEKELVVS